MLVQVRWLAQRCPLAYPLWAINCHSPVRMPHLRLQTQLQPACHQLPDTPPLLTAPQSHPCLQQALRPSPQWEHPAACMQQDSSHVE
jgi:hypothetical protein